MAEKHLYNLGGMRTAAIAFAVIAIATFAMQIERLLAGNVLAEFGFILVLILCWMAAMFGSRGIVKYRPEFAQAYRASMLAVLCTVVGAGMAFVLWHRGSGSQAFIHPFNRNKPHVLRPKSFGTFNFAVFAKLLNPSDGNPNLSGSFFRRNIFEFHFTLSLINNMTDSRPDRVSQTAPHP
jgi:hypothetical protein